MGGCYNTTDLDRSPAKLGNWYHTYNVYMYAQHQKQLSEN